MPRTLPDELKRRIAYLSGTSFLDAPTRLTGFLNWLETEPTTQSILIRLRGQSDINAILQGCGQGIPPKVSEPEDVARVGLFIIERCKENPDTSRLAGLLFNLSCDTSLNNFDFTFEDAIRKYIDPFLRHLQEEVAAIPERLTLDSAVKLRQDAFLSPDFERRFPETSRLLQNLSKEMMGFVESENWFNIANSCRETLKAFCNELQSVLLIQKPDEIKAGDFKGIIRCALSQRMEKSRSRETLQDVACSVWDYLQTLLHNNATTRAEAMRIYLWTGMVISEVFSQVGQVPRTAKAESP